MHCSFRRSLERGFADHGWLQSRHTFSFADYHDPRHMGFRSLRVINEDWIAPGAGFPTHPHRDMEIFTVMVEGVLEHRDSMGNHARIRPGDIQVMSAGSGITHSEFNPDSSQPAHLLQIWIQPRERGLVPRYTEWRPNPEMSDAAKALIISPTGREGSAILAQDAEVYRLRMAPGEGVEHSVREGRGVWLQIIAGEAEQEGTVLEAGDALRTEDPGPLRLRARTAVEALLFDLA
jgi:redox-sensitive bicupin YhaK (pirin superfamily)